jgi:hypothetical protein
MFGFRKTPAPALRESNTGIGFYGNVSFVRGDKHWAEEYNVLNAVASVLEARGDSFEKEESWLVHTASQFILVPQLAAFQPLDDGGVQTTTTIQVNHPALIPEGLFEYQHSTGSNMQDSILKGIEQWAELDLVPLLESLQQQPETCNSLRMSIPAKDGQPARARRAVLGPVMHFMEKPPEAGHTAIPAEEAHLFCPCCLLTNTFEDFKPLFEGTALFGVRLFAARGQDGVPQADCRVNGDDWEQGANALREYVKIWPDSGYEFRKQYIVFQTIEDQVHAK